ncbi:glycoside hydrolase family 16 protein [Marinilabilia salmonicolor]|uniref:glycoside hydrolase family 16 protein n=1 Tax=Marinilabilia salmonicolor TaxID=989 RepID=UPI00190145CA|nr:glycoside hydrolase family 16 protein [Marinilabilia salmonicolor]
MKTPVYLIILITSVLMFSSCTNNNEWELAWADEFNYKGLPDSTKWMYEYGPPYKNREKQFYEKENLKYSRVENGHLIIEAHKEKREGADYVSASLRTSGKKEFLYGRIEARLKMPKGRVHGPLSGCWEQTSKMQVGRAVASWTSWNM